MPKVFVVDDEPAMRELVVAILAGTHEVVLQASSLQEAKEAIPQVKQLGISVCIIDGAFPHFGDGAALSKVLREQIPTIKIISLSGDYQPWGDRHLSKMNILLLLQVIEEVLT